MSSLTHYAWVSLLADRYVAAIANSQTATEALAAQLPTLQLAQATLEKINLRHEYPQAATQIAILGPTQSGKSTLTNVLLDSDAAAISALAGFTVHTQGYSATLLAEDIDRVEKLMSPLRRSPANSLDSGNLDCYVLEHVTSGKHSLAAGAVVWDTPDFDSIEADSYSLAVLKTAALADKVVLTVSKDKYGDQRVWDILTLLAALAKPLVVCINKLDASDKAVVENAFMTRYREHFGTPLPTLLTVPFIKDASHAKSTLLDDTSRQAWHQALQALDVSIDHDQELAHCERFIESHQNQWLKPLIAEIDASDRWNVLIDAVIGDADEYYASTYLDNPDKYETFNRALVELLTLLEIPGVAPGFAHARQLITWPARKLLGVGRTALGREPQPMLDSHGKIMDQEALVMQHMLDSSLNQLQKELLESPAEPWWQALNSGLRTARPTIKTQFEQASEQARRDFEPEIGKAAKQLYEQLEKQPALLNTLRAARVSADAAGIALAVKSGGLAPTDLILAPAMLSITTLLTESALGRYLESVKRDLKQRQRAHVKQYVLEQTLQTSLKNVVLQLPKNGLLSGALEPELQQRLNTSVQS